MQDIAEKLRDKVTKRGLCTGCGACVALCGGGASRMMDTSRGPVPFFAEEEKVPSLAWEVCPGKGLNYPGLYSAHYGRQPESRLTGHAEKVRTGYAADPDIRRSGASGGVITRVLLYLLETGRIDGAVLARQGVPTPLAARAVICTTPEEIRACAQSVYIPVSMLDMLRDLPPGKRYAMTCLPEQSAALRALQQGGFAPARQIRYVLGPYTGTALEPAAIDCYLRMNRVPAEDAVISLRWRAGEWPGYLEIITQHGRVLRSPKVYYNFLIPFFITRTSLQSIDFCNEFADLAVGDAWSPALEAERGGHSVLSTRTPEMEAIVRDMCEKGLLTAHEVDPLEASNMHGHMLDFKKRGAFIRNRWRRFFGLGAPEYGMHPACIPAGRYAVEGVNMLMFLVAGSAPARWLVRRIPERVLGPFFDAARLRWKALSKPTKRRGLKRYEVVVEEDHA